jgi:hypothetical protein
VDEVVTLDRRFMFAADPTRQIDGARVAVRIRPYLKDVLLVDAGLESGVTQEFLLRSLREGQPRSLLDKPYQRKVALELDYFGFRTASNGLWVGYGLVAPNGLGSNGRGPFMQPLSTRRRRAVRN